MCLPFRKIIKKALLYLLVPLACVPFGASGQVKTEYSPVYLKNAIINPVPNAQQWLDSMAYAHIKGKMQALIQFSTIPTAQQQHDLKNIGITLLDYVPSNGYTAIVDFSKHIEMSGLPIVSIVNMLPEWKIDGYLLERLKIVKRKMRRYLYRCATV